MLLFAMDFPLISLLKFIFEYTKTSAKSNFQELNSSGMLEVKNGIPVSVRKRIEELFNQAMMGNVRPKDLHKELNDWNLFEEYQDRFFSIFK